MDGTLQDRLAALERAVTDGDHDCSALAEGAATADRVAEFETELSKLTDRVAELEAATQALRGYVGNVRSVNTEIEERADLALSKAEAARRAVDGAGTAPGEGERPATGTDRSTPRSPEHGSSGRCARCERPLDGARGQPPETNPTGQGADGPTDGSSGLDALREPDWTASRDLESALAAAETDGGIPEKKGEETSSVLARVRGLL